MIIHGLNISKMTTLDFGLILLCILCFILHKIAKYKQILIDKAIEDYEKNKRFKI